MGTFRRVSHLKTWIIGSVQSDTGSEYMFGFDPQEGLQWLERSGVEYTPIDKAWREADNFIRRSLKQPQQTQRPQGDIVPADDEVYEVDESSHEGVDALHSFEDVGVPITGKRGSVSKTPTADYGMGAAPQGRQPQQAVGSFGVGEEYEDDEIADNAAAMFATLEE